MSRNAQAVKHSSSAVSAANGEPMCIHPVKATFDKVVALLAGIVLAPLLLLTALAIKIDGWLYPEDRGPVFYKEARISQDRVFDLCKFRVLKVAVMKAARKEKGYDHAKPLERCEQNMTRVGRWVQRWYLDELPQLLNVFKGDLSLVGPRPWPVPKHREELAQGIYRKRVLRPGLTGLVQAHKDELSAMGGDRALDETYIEACRTLGPLRLLLLDLRLMIETFRIIAKGQGL